MGLFRYVKSGAIVKNLSVGGVISPVGSETVIGGIAGSNAGTILHCSFSGTVVGKSCTGGIAGINTESGRIAGCSTDASVTGEKFTGGIAGKNLGTIISCSGNCSVNITAVEQKISIDEINIDSTWDKLTSSSDKNEDADSSVVGHTDTGGIAGYSSGIIQSCLNTGTIGYAHVGYNVGGIAGRQAGYLNYCTNKGVVLGRKDVGGIVGQAEPYIIIDLSADTLKMIEQELKTLNILVNTAIDDYNGSSAVITARLDTINSYTDSAKDSAKKLSGKTTDFADSNISEVNRIGDIAAGVTERMIPVMDNFGTSTDKVTEALKKSDELFTTLEKISDDNAEAIRQARYAADELKSANVYISTAYGDINDALSHLSQALIVNDQTAVNDALSNLSAAVTGLGGSMNQASAALQKLSTALGNVSDWGNISANQAEISAALSDLGNALSSMSGSFTDIGNALTTISQNTTINWNETQSALNILRDAMAQLQASSTYLSAAGDYLKTTLDSVSSAADKSGSAFEQAQGVTASVSEATEFFSDSIGGMKELISELAAKDPIKFTLLGDDYRTESERLFNSITGITTEAAELNKDVYSSSQTMSEDIRQVCNQAQKVSQLIVTLAETIRDDTDADLSDFIEDTSDLDTDKTTLGKISDCKNFAEIQGDRNVGGIIGTMAVDYDLDPEDDISGTISHNKTYETKAVLQRCVNNSSVTAKKDCSGGCIGRMDLGTVISCENYGSIKSDSGSYVGGIAGTSSSIIRKSFVKCSLYGKTDVGGIAGNADTLTDCASIIKIYNAQEKFGAIAGDTDEISSEKLSGNFYLDTGFAAIDGISYAGIAESTDYKKLCAIKNVPAAFKTFRLTFMADDTRVAEFDFYFGDNLSKDTLPAIPEKDGYYAEWEEYDTTGRISDLTVNAIYKPWINILESNDGKTPSTALAEGIFKDDAVLNVKECTAALPQINKRFQTAEAWEISLENTDLTPESSFSLRLFCKNGKNAAVYALNNGAWEKVPYETNGNYLIVTMTGTSASFCIVYGIIPLMYAITAAAAVLIIAVVAVLAITRHRKNKKSKA